MNWELAKSWLLVAFLLLDLFLGWQVYESRREFLGYVASVSDQLANTKTILSEHGFILATAVPSEHPDMPLIRADFAAVPLEDLGRLAFPPSSSWQVDAQAGTLHADQGEIRTLGQGQWQVRFTAPIPWPNQGLAGLPGVWQPGQYQEDTGLAVAAGLSKDGRATGTRVFVQTANGFPVFDAAVSVALVNGRVTGFTQTALVNVAAAGDAKPTISAMDALDSLAGAVDKSAGGADNKILSVTLGYVHKVPKTASGVQGAPAQGYWFPVWRVVTPNHLYDINALTGEVDTES
ncbi:two-component system regulatory protein YycI [Alicyclobacillus sp.]|uniref:two-component system regulatory protein YycI n=1 Tax=Alicyclobacillus sp. TaxID=61169 RepID=UPI0025C59B0A|nr:two-component system regulatory protein YycI [Alicyclobacillus sp.]MCL6516030.1 two-component system regulatory protein YycI [Alicyclobacillus sp.]